MSPTLSIAIPFYDDKHEALQMVDAVRHSIHGTATEFLLIDIRGGRNDDVPEEYSTDGLRYLQAPNLPSAKNRAATVAEGDFLLYLFPGLFPLADAIKTLFARLKHDASIVAVAGCWSNATGKLEVGYNIRRFPTLLPLIVDILILNKLLPRNALTRRYKMHDFDHATSVSVEHANDCVFMVRREVVHACGGFNDSYLPGWFDQVEFCRTLAKGGHRIVYVPEARFISNDRPPLLNRLVRDYYVEYRRAECLYIRNQLGPTAHAIARSCVALGMIMRLGFSISLPRTFRTRLLSNFHTYVDDRYIQRLRRSYWSTLKESVIGSA